MKGMVYVEADLVELDPALGFTAELLAMEALAMLRKHAEFAEFLIATNRL